MTTEGQRVGSPVVRVAFVPYWGPRNPYQDRLANCLEDCGAQVHKYATLKALAHDILFGRFRPQVVHLHWISRFGARGLGLARAASFLLRLCLLRVAGIRLVWTVHNLLPHESRHPRLDMAIGWLTARLAHCLIVHSATAKAEVCKGWGLAASKPIHVVPHPNYIGCYPDSITRAQARQRLDIPESGVVLLFLGAVRPYKGVLQLVDSFKALDDASTFLLIAGRPLNDDFAQTVNDAIQGNGNIRFHAGFVSDDDVQVYMNAADVVVLPYLRTLSSGAVMLAMSFGKACVAPALGSIADLLDASGAFLYDPTGEDALGKALSQAYGARERLARMGAHNREKAEQYSWENAAALTMIAYDRNDGDPCPVKRAQVHDEETA